MPLRVRIVPPKLTMHTHVCVMCVPIIFLEKIYKFYHVCADKLFFQNCFIEYHFFSSENDMHIQDKDDYIVETIRGFKLFITLLSCPP
jgi:hypothetical protein